MVHAARHWIDAHQADANYVLLQKDIRNAFNEVLPYEFLKDAQEHAPSSARFAAFCYGNPSHLIYNGTSTMCFRGQQGCPIMGPLFCLTRQRFQAVGVKIVSTTDVMMLKVPVSQGTTIFQSFHQQKIDDFRGLCKRLLQLPHAHIALYLMRQGGTYNKIQYWCRTMPRRILAPLLQDIHDCQKHFLDQLIGKPLTPL